MEQGSSFSLSWNWLLILSHRKPCRLPWAKAFYLPHRGKKDEESRKECSLIDDLCDNLCDKLVVLYKHRFGMQPWQNPPLCSCTAKIVVFDSLSRPRDLKESLVCRPRLGSKINWRVNFTQVIMLGGHNTQLYREIHKICKGVDAGDR
jgi:hypothetical protein